MQPQDMSLQLPKMTPENFSLTVAERISFDLQRPLVNKSRPPWPFDLHSEWGLQARGTVVELQHAKIWLLCP